VRVLLCILTILALPPLPAAALDAKVSLKLERIASDPTTDVYALADKASDFFFSKVRESCAREVQTTPDECEVSRILELLDVDGVLSERCAALVSRREKIVCAVGHARPLRMVAALKGDPGEDIDWESSLGSDFALRDELWNVAWLHCKSIGSYTDDCLARRQAELLGFPSAAGSFCAEKRADKRRCLDALLTLAVYLEAMEGLDTSRQL
jgi:hypothetical protein